jgi:hypothetical protein
MSTYETDFYRWTQETAELLRRRRFSELDIENLIEEVDSIGRNEKYQISKKISQILVCLLKWMYFPNRRIYHWQTTIGYYRDFLELTIKDSPSLSKYVCEEEIKESYEGAKVTAILELGVEDEEDIFPDTFEQTGWSWKQVLDTEFLPERFP